MATIGDNGGPQHVALGPSRRFTVQDLAAVAAGQATVELEKSALEKLPPSNLSGTTTVVPSVTPRGAELGPTASRAVIVARLVSLMQGRSAVGRDVAELLAALLNRGVAPLLHVESAGAELAGLVMGGPVMATFLDNGAAGLKAADVFERLGMVPLQSLAEEEAKAMSEGSFARTGPAALEAGAISSLVTTADAVAAVSCEAVKASTEPFSEKLWDQRPHRGQMTSAANLRLLLSNSGLANATAPGGESSYDFTSIPQIHGPCRETIEAGVKSMELELNVAEKADEAPFHPAQVEVVLVNMQNAARAFVRASAGRLSVLRKAKSEAAEGGVPQQNGSAVVTAAEVRQALAAEASEALSQLRALSDAAEAAAKAKEEKAKPVGPERGGGKPEEPLEEMDPAKRAKIEAARKAKAEKAAAKAAAKAAKSGRSVVLGQGTREVKDWIEARTGGSLDVSAVADAIDPLAAGSASLSAFVLRLLERLGSGGAQRKPKIVKGARDFNGEEMLVREEAFDIIRSIFKVHGAHEIDTPVFELKETLTGKYGEDSKLIYDLADQGGELLSLRYDLTVPFARYLAINNTINLKRYHIAKVYRRDNPAMNRGRFREFYQCDFDIAGSYPLMVPDAEVITVAVEILTALPIGTFEIKLNHRRLLDSIFEVCGVPNEKFRTICSAVDKLDKEPWSEVKREMTEEKGLKPEVADRIGEFVCLRGAPRQLLSKLESDKMFGDHEGATAALKELDVLFGYLEALGSLDYVVFDMSLARGLDYYTGVIYEAVLTHNESQVGSIAAGGRYDKLVGMFSGQPTPCVGVSVGVERVLTIMADQRQKKQQDRNPFVEVLVMSIGKGMLPHRMRLARALWQAGISAEYLPQENPTLKRQMEHAHESRIPFLVIVGADEIEQGVVKVKDPSKPQGESEEAVPESEMVQSLMSKGSRVVGRRRVGPSSSAAEEVRGVDSV